MPDNSLLGPWIRRFLLEHVVAERNLARNTQASYHNTLHLLLPFLQTVTKTPIDRLTVEKLTPTAVQRFLAHLKQAHGCGSATRNLRLGAIHSLAKFIGSRSPEHLAWAIEVRTIPCKKTAPPTLAYLEKPEMDALLQAPNRQTAQGRRDYAVLLFLYNTGARADEAAHLTIGDVTGGSAPAVRLVGKRDKTRHCPLWPRTAVVLQVLAGAAASSRCFATAGASRSLVLGSTSWCGAPSKRPAGSSPRSNRSGSARIPCGILVRSTCSGPGSTST
jgi:site-specific recombinase XerD